MRNGLLREGRRMVAWVATLLLVGIGTAMAQAGTISGKVTEGNTNGPLVGARVQATGTNYFAVTNQLGTYTIRGVAPGSYTLRVIMLGYSSATKPVTVAGGQVASVD